MYYNILKTLHWKNINVATSPTDSWWLTTFGSSLFHCSKFHFKTMKYGTLLAYISVSIQSDLILSELQ